MEPLSFSNHQLTILIFNFIIVSSEIDDDVISDLEVDDKEKKTEVEKEKDNEEKKEIKSENEDGSKAEVEKENERKPRLILFLAYVLESFFFRYYVFFLFLVAG